MAFADRGTLFLDEIGTLSLATQAKLLTLIEQQQFIPLGARSLQTTQIDVRVISATNLPLQRAAEDGTFRSDLFHRLNGVTIELPPLRNREGDLELLARHLVATLGRRLGKSDLDMSRDALDCIRGYAWPGNVRELQRVLSAAVVLADTEITVDDLPEHIREAPPALEVDTPVSDMPINLREIKEWAGREAQKRVIMELQKRTSMSRQELARLLGVDPKTLRSRLKEISGLPRTR